MKIIINPFYYPQTKNLIKIIQNFEQNGRAYGDGKRNIIKIFESNELKLNVKSFKTPIFFNKVIYGFFRASKAQRSYMFANKLIKKSVNTPTPIAYFEEHRFLGLYKSYYISEHFEFDFMFRDLIENSEKFDFENILRQFSKFCFDLHENGIEFLDHSPGNTLIKKQNFGRYDFYLVDLNRMKFHQNIDFENRMNNLKRLLTEEYMVKIVSNEYSKFYDKTEMEIFEKLWSLTTVFQQKYYKKIELKKKFFFWKK